ncbi:hypothetical protein SAMN02745163_00609 [Clostridium cavendishii DSM 21758]|uniref:Uncharacterized protein n=1 Tax=Clostridium cavendishii DSM 21758 TaxID=1121302 RepID=A0A1M6D1X0_9CLOT|nr:hypothetical protein [Clostridium cavendishii]SHI67064.1 hypothetical protein SAMN02745163_00609 [Clostridium cavendishii DSM 21758]
MNNLLFLLFMSSGLVFVVFGVFIKLNKVSLTTKKLKDKIEYNKKQSKLAIFVGVLYIFFGLASMNSTTSLITNALGIVPLIIYVILNAKINKDYVIN